MARLLTAVTTVREMEEVAHSEPGCFVACARVEFLDCRSPDWRRRFMQDRTRRWMETQCADCALPIVVSDRMPREPLKVCLMCTVHRIARAPGRPVRVLRLVDDGFLKETLMAV